MSNSDDKKNPAWDEPQYVGNILKPGSVNTNKKNFSKLQNCNMARSSQIT